LGIAYSKGTGVAKNYVRAYMWLTLAVAQRDSNGSNQKERIDGGRLLDAIANSMTAAQIGEAQKFATQCKASNYKNCE